MAMKKHLQCGNRWFCDKKNDYAFKSSRYNNTVNVTLETTCKKCLSGAKRHTKFQLIQNPGHEYYKGWLERIEKAKNNLLIQRVI
jgi:hypothetical protein